MEAAFYCAPKGGPEPEMKQNRHKRVSVDTFKEISLLSGPNCLHIVLSILRFRSN